MSFILNEPIIDPLIPLPPHVGAEQYQDSIDAANRPFEELAEITDSPLIEKQLNKNQSL